MNHTSGRFQQATVRFVRLYCWRLCSEEVARTLWRGDIKVGPILSVFKAPITRAPWLDARFYWVVARRHSISTWRFPLCTDKWKNDLFVADRLFIDEISISLQYFKYFNNFLEFINELKILYSLIIIHVIHYVISHDKISISNQGTIPLP